MKTRQILIISLLLAIVLTISSDTPLRSQSMTDYCYTPPFMSSAAPPLVMLVMSRDHKLYYEAYNDASDLDEDGKLDITYDHSILYYGYFDSYKCYQYDSSGTAKFTPVSVTSTKFCSAGQWSGNLLNWLTMSRMDVLRKVLYGGHRITDSSSSTVLERVFIPQDAHSWGKEYTGRLCYNGTKYTKMCSLNSDCDSGYTCNDVSNNLIGMVAPSGVCNANPVAWDSTGNVLVVYYAHSSSNTTCGTSHNDLLSSYEPGKYQSHFYITDFNANEVKPTTDKYQSYSNLFAVTEFEVPAGAGGSWQFYIDGNDGVELEIGGVIVASKYSCNLGTSSTGTVTLTAGTWYRLIVRHAEKIGKEGVRVYYKKPADASFTIFGDTLNLRSPNVASDNTCALEDTNFILTGTPGSGSITTGPINKHLFCNTTMSAGGAPVLRLLTDKGNRIWEWASKERPVCDNSLGTPTEYQVRVEVCKSSVGLETNCKRYPSSGGTYKPTGLLQKYGEGDGSKVCSKKFTKSCNTDSDCSASEGRCIEKGKMLYGLITGSYEKNLSGGVLRKNIWSILDETNAETGIFQSSESTQGNIIQTIDNLKIVGFRYSDYSYQDSSGGTCGWITGSPLSEGQCKSWGNPMGEMLYETLRYLAGKGTPTSAFTYTSSGSTDAGLGLKIRDWGVTKGGTTYQPYDVFPSCAKPFILAISDVNTSYDSDKVPGTSFGSYTGDLTNLDVSSLADTIGTNESIGGNNWFIGETNISYDYMCSMKSVSSLKFIRGLCPEEPTKQGSFYSASVAYYGRTMLNANTGKPNVSTFAVALSSAVADISLKVGGNYVRLVPTGKSVSGCLGVFSSCATKCSLSVDSNGSLVISGCTSSAYCPTNQIVDYYVEKIVYDSDKNVTYAKFRINYEDVEQGADHDMDSIVEYEICTGSSCDPAIASNQVQIKLNSTYGAGCIDQVLGFVISGTSEDGVYLPVKDKDVSAADADTPTQVAGLPLTWEKTFTVSGTAAGFLKDPLWYAAKYGGFDDLNGNNIPDQTAEWDKYNNSTGLVGADGIPDTYFKVVNPLKMEQQMERAFSEILRRASSGTTVVTLPPTQSRESFVMLQTYFYPEKQDGSTSLKWVGFLRTMWADSAANIRDNHDVSGESNVLKLLDMIKDRIMAFIFSDADQSYVAKIYTDANGDAAPDSCSSSTIGIDNVESVWEAGTLLKTRTPSDRTIKTWVDSNSNGIVDSGEFVDFSTSLKTTLKNYWSYTDIGVCDDNCAESVIKYVLGYDRPDPSGSGFRLRQGSDTTGSNITSSWKLGDVIFSTPKISPNKAVNGYDTRYKDKTYTAFINNTISNVTPIAIMGANDGMLHAFKVGKLEDIKPPTADGGGKQVAKLSTSGTGLGAEEWGFIPRNVIPYLRWFCQDNYCHIPMVDTTFTIVDASIGENSDTVRASNGSSWRRLLIGAMGFGGTSISVSGATFSSSIFILDITNPGSPTLLWEKQLPDNTLTSGTPAVVRFGASDKNGTWYIVIGSGASGLTTNTLSYPASPKIFVFDLRDGSQPSGTPLTLSTFDADAVNIAVGDFLGTDMDYPSGDYNPDDLYFGTYNNSTGKLYRIRMRDGSSYITSPGSWVVSQVVNAARPVFAAPTISIDGQNNLWLYFGTGLYLTTEHTTATNEKLFGFKETNTCWTSAGTGTECTYTNFLNTTAYQFINASAIKISCKCEGGIIFNEQSCSSAATCPSCTEGSRFIIETTGATFSGGSCNEKVEGEAITCMECLINTGRTDCSTGGTSYNGWVVDVTEQKIYSSPLVAGGIVATTPFKPSDDICNAGGESFIMALHYTIGSPYFQPIIPIADAGLTNITLLKSTFGGKGAPPIKQSLVSVPTGDTYKVFTQASGGIIGLNIQPSVPYQANRFVQWLTK